MASISYGKFCELLQRCAQHFAGTGFLDEDNESHIAGVVRCHYVATDVAGKSLLPVNVQFSFAQEGLLCWHCRLLTFVNNPFSSQNGGPSDPNSTLSAPTVLEYQLQLPFPQFTCVANDVRLIANSTYHGLQLLAEKRYSNGLQFLAIYTWSKSIDDSSQADDNVTWPGSFSSLQDPNKPWLERSLSTFDIPHVLQFSYTYDLPFGRSRALLNNMPRWAEAIVGGWKTKGI